MFVCMYEYTSAQLKIYKEHANTKEKNMNREIRKTTISAAKHSLQNPCPPPDIHGDQQSLGTGVHELQRRPLDPGSHGHPPPPPPRRRRPPVPPARPHDAALQAGHAHFPQRL